MCHYIRCLTRLDTNLPRLRKRRKSLLRERLRVSLLWHLFNQPKVHLMLFSVCFRVFAYNSSQPYGSVMAIKFLLSLFLTIAIILAFLHSYGITLFPIIDLQYGGGT